MIRVRLLSCGLLTTALFALAACRPVSAQLTFTYTSFDPSGLNQPGFSGISNTGALVGTYGSHTPYAGFLYQNGVTTTVSYPNAVSRSETDLLSINSAGIATGDYIDFAANTETYFLYNSNTQTFTSPSHSNATETAYNAINDAGQVAAVYADANGVHSAIYNFATQAFTDLPDQSSPVTAVQDISADGDAVVNYTDANGNLHGSLLHNGVYTNLDFPGASQTGLDAINANGLIVGGYIDTNGGDHGLVYDAGTFYSLDFPGASATNVTFGLNDANQIAGYYIDANGAFHGLLVQVTPEPGSVALLVGLSVAGAGFLRRRVRKVRAC